MHNTPPTPPPRVIPGHKETLVRREGKAWDNTDAARENEEPVPVPPSRVLGQRRSLEMAWAMRARHHADIYLLCVPLIFETLGVDVSDPEERESESAKEKCRPFCLKCEGIVEDYN